MTKGIHYPVNQLEGFGHHSFARLAPRRMDKGNHWKSNISNLKDSYEQLFSTFKKDTLNIVSSEDFHNCSPEAIHEIFSPYETRVLVYIRNELDFLSSSYCQKVHATDTIISPEEYVSRRKSGLTEFLNSWHKFFDSNLEIRIFSKSSLVGGDIIKDFLVKSLCLDPKDFHITTKDQNPSLTRKFLAFKLYLNKHYNVNDHKNQLYQYLARLSAVDQSGKFYFPTRINEELVPVFKREQEIWSPKYFGVNQIFDYDQIKTSDLYSLENKEIESLMKDLLREIPDLTKKNN